MSLSRVGICLGLVFALGACGFRPLYAPPAEDRTGQRVYAFDSFRQIEILRIPNREGQLLRNRLSLLLHPKGRDRAAKYVLSINLKESLTDLAVRKSADSARANLTIVARFNLAEVRSPDNSISGTVRSTSGYNVLSSEYQTLVSEQGARERALNDVAEQIRLRVGALMTNPQETKSKP